MKALRLRESCIQYTVGRNRYGDLVTTQVGTILCLFRNVSTIDRTGNREERTIDGIFWFAPDATVKQGDVVGFAGLKYRLTKVTIANQRLTTNSTHFIKCNASLLRQIS